METLDYLAHLRRELATFEACLGGDLSAPVEHCGGWDLYRLADHLGRGSLWAAAAITDNRGDHTSARAPREPAELAAWFHAAVAVLLTALEADPATEAWTFYPPHTVGFWRRRRAMETLIHRWDAEQAIGAHTGFDPGLAADGVAEVVDTMAPYQVAAGRASTPTQAVRLVSTDGSSWVLGTGDPVGTVTASAADLLLMLWNRLPDDHPAIAWSGDIPAARTVLTGPLVP